MAGRASLILLVLVVLGLILRWATLRLAARADAVRARLDTLARSAPVRWAHTRFSVPLAWLRARTTPGATHGLGWTLSVVLAGSAAWLFGAAVQDLLAREELALLDRPVATAAVLQRLLPNSANGARFPAGSVTWLTAALVAALPAVAVGDLTTAIRTAGIGIGFLTPAGITQLVASTTTLSGIVGALGVGALIGIGSELTARTVPTAREASAAT